MTGDLVPSPQNLDLSIFERLSLQIAEATSVTELKSISDGLTALRACARIAKDREAETLAVEWRDWAQRAAGEMLIGLDIRRGRKKKLSLCSEQSKTSAVEPDISPNNRMIWKRKARMPIESFRAQLDRRLERIRNGRRGALQSSQSDEWYSPKSVLDRAVMCLGSIDLDPCAEEPKAGLHNVPAARHITKKDNGLAHPWRGAVYMNPPYGFQVDDWCDKLLAEYRQENVTKAVALLAARTDTRWFRAFKHAPACFVSGRLRFSDTNLHAPFPSVLFYLGPDKSRFIASFAALGQIRDAAVAG